MILAKNKKAYFDYEILQTFEAGIQLRGHEVKSIKNKQVNMKGSLASITKGEAFLENVNVSKYSYATIPDYNPTRKRKLLLKKKEIDKIDQEISQKGITFIPLEIFLKNNLIKVKLGICRGKKKHDKRATLKKRAIDKDIKQKLKHY